MKSNPNNQDVFKVKVFRFDPSLDQEPHYDHFEVPYLEGETVLGILHYIRDNFDSTLTFRDSCEVGCCAICTLRINGKAGLSCQKKAPSRELVIEPLDKNKVLRDLAML